MRKHKLRYSALVGMVLVAVMLLTASCLPSGKQFHSYRSMPSCGWVWGDTVLFVTPLSDSLAHYHYTVEVRHDNSYPFRQLAVAFSVNPVDEPAIYSDTLTCQLSNDQGVWQGQGWGNLFISTHPGRTFTIPHGGSYVLSLSHIMKQDTLPGIFNVGIKIETARGANQE
ncbi:MAG: gliding motility lipoprotein GldH [Bacteroides sp.]